MKNKVWQIAGVLALVGVLGKFYAPPLLAQVRAALVQDRDAEGRNIYQANSNCNSPDPCVIAFPAVPAGKRLIIKQASALVKFGAGGTIVSVQLRGGTVFQYLPVIATPGNFAGETDFVAHAPVLASYEAGEQPNMDAFSPTGGSFLMVASISGYMIDIP
jgi:hypothetical protein